MKQQTPILPNFDEIIQKCKAKIECKFDDYGNSWVGYSDWQFWMNRLQGEIAEIWQTSNPKQFEKEIVDAINILSMMYMNSDYWSKIHSSEGVKE